MTLLTGCSPDTVRLAYRPVVGELAVYRISVRAVTITSLAEDAPRRRVVVSVLTARLRVLESGARGSRVEVQLHDKGGERATFAVRFDRAGQLTEVERTAGVAAGALGELGLPEIFPAAGAAPPRRPLAPGDHWSIDGPVRLAGPREARLAGQGRLVSLGRADGRRLARVQSTYRLPVRRTADATGGRLLLDGTLETRSIVAYDLDDTEVESVTAHTTGRSALTIIPPADMAGLAGVAVQGTLDIDVSSTSRRIG